MELWGAALYGDPCRECEFDWSLSPIDAIAFVEELPDRLAEATAGATGEERGPAGGWSVKEYVSHVGDNLRAWAERVQGARLAGDQVIAGYDPDSLANARNYATIPLPAAVWSAGISAREWAPVLQQAVVERVELHHATRGVQCAEDIARNNFVTMPTTTCGTSGDFVPWATPIRSLTCAKGLSTSWGCRPALSPA